MIPIPRRRSRSELAQAYTTSKRYPSFAFHSGLAWPDAEDGDRSDTSTSRNRMDGCTSPSGPWTLAKKASLSRGTSRNSVRLGEEKELMGDRPPIPCHHLRILFLANHLNGKDTHVRGLRIFGAIGSVLVTPSVLSPSYSSPHCSPSYFRFLE